ncbi:MAG: beta-N-acetylhexosaminidase [Candidatus Melainabacteria bacterium]|nr:MAG: beta-N-acetylhexosaminidase [Candidatus Melainabacteria bacterium]
MPADESLEKAVGRLLVGRLSGKTLDAEYEQLLKDGTAGGICIFKDNVESLTQLSELVAKISRSSIFNPIICVDQEGGAVQRFDDVLSPLPSLMALAATDNEKFAETAAVVNGKQLRALGVNCVLSPVVDVASNPLNPIIGTRAFSCHAEKVSRFAKAMLEAFMQEGVVPVIKHFPGHGDTGQDSHSELAVIDRAKQSVEELELKPFKNCAQLAPALLAGHVWLTAYEKEPLPATLSSKLLEGVLRKELGFDGLIFTDDMMMKAITNKYGLAESALLAVEAGCDVVLLCSSAAELKNAHQHIIDAVRSGRLKEERIQQANERIEKLFANKEKPSIDPKSRVVQLKGWLADDNARISSIYQSAITLLQGKFQNITDNRVTVIAPNHPRYPLPLGKFLQEQLKFSGMKPALEEIRYTVDPGQTEIETLSVQAKDKSVVLVTFRAGLNRGQLKLAKAMEQSASNFIGIAADIPYDCLAVPKSATYMCTFDPSDKAMEELAVMLVRRMGATGKCPVALETDAINS